MSATCILVVEDDLEMRRLLEEELRELGYEVVSAANGHEAIERFDAVPVDLVLTDLVMPGMRGLELLTAIRGRARQVPVIIMTAFGSIESAVESMRGGAHHYLTKPFRIDQLEATLAEALQHRPARRSARARGPAIVARSAAMRRALDLVERAAASDTPVLLLGESGTGKELLARRLHAQSRRADGPFLAVNCSAIPESLLESQLFGHRRGAFTDAREDRKGLVQEAEGGTLFLDEIGDMPLSLQSKLLRVVQEREVHPLGAPAPVAVDVRVAAATHRDLERMCAEGRFRSDLYYRLNVISVPIPALRNRPEDLMPLVEHFVQDHGARLGRPGVRLEEAVVERLVRHSWPGNVRELENAIERALVLGRGVSIGLEDLPESVLGTTPPPALEAGGVRALAEVEREEIVRALRSVRGNKAAAARLLGLDRKTLYRKIEVYGIDDREI